MKRVRAQHMHTFTTRTIHRQRMMCTMHVNGNTISRKKNTWVVNMKWWDETRMDEKCSDRSTSNGYSDGVCGLLQGGRTPPHAHVERQPRLKQGERGFLTQAVHVLFKHDRNTHAINKHSTCTAERKHTAETSRRRKMEGKDARTYMLSYFLVRGRHRHGFSASASSAMRCSRRVISFCRAFFSSALFHAEAQQGTTVSSQDTHYR
jgi:hypothetical protein